MLDVKIEGAKKFFFDREVVTKKLNDSEKKILPKIGAKVRMIARRSMKPAPRRQPVAVQKRRGRKATRPPVSAPGSPPYTHTNLLKNGILYYYDAPQHSVVVGPTRLNAKQQGIPGILEFGGTETISKTRKGGQGTTKNVTYAPRPYMQPALDAVTPTLPSEWAGAVSK